jgi:biopolymer transport protein ExbD
MSFQSPLRQSTRPVMLLGQSHLRPQGANIKKKAATLMITSLVDAFSILVIYLLFGPAISGEAVSPDLKLQLPVAYQSSLADNETSLVIKNNHYYLQNKEVAPQNLVSTLKKVSTRLGDKSKKALVIIADQKNDIEKINPVLIAASEAGLSQLRLAVEHQGE